MTKRPQLHDPEVIENLAGRLFPNVKAWLEEHGEIFTGQLEQDLFDELVDLLHQMRGHWDGYELARELEERSWEPNAELVEILDEAEALAHLALREEVVRWVSTNALVPSYVVGDTVTFRLYENDSLIEGRVTKVYPSSLEYSVQLDNGVTLLIPEEHVCGGAH